MNNQPDSGSNLAQYLDHLRSAADPAVEQQHKVESPSESLQAHGRKLLARTGHVTVIHDNEPVRVVCFIEERGQGIFILHGLPSGWWTLTTRDEQPEWDGDVDERPTQASATNALSYVARPVPSDTAESGQAHSLDGMRDPLSANAFFQTRERHRWVASKFDPEKPEKPVVALSK